MKIGFILLAACFINSYCFSQKQWPPEYEIKTDTAFLTNITANYWMVLEDKDGKWKLGDILRMQQAGKFHDSSTSFDTTLHTYWFVYKLRNTMARDARVSLNSLSDFDDFNIKLENGKWLQFTTGKSNDWEKKDGLKIADCIPVVIHPGELYTVYQRMSNIKAGLPEFFQVGFLSTDEIISDYYINPSDKREKYFYPINLQEAFIIGMILLSVFLNLFFYSIVKEKVYIYFAFFAFFLALNRCYGISYTYFQLFDPKQLKYVRYLGYAWVFIAFFLVQFFRHFLDTAKRFPRFDKWFFRLVVAFTLSFFTIFILYAFNVKGIKWFDPVSIIFIFLFIPIVLLVAQFICLHQGKANRVVFFGSLPLLSLYIVSQFFTPDGFNIFPGNFLARNFRLIEALSLLVILVSFTWVLLMRFIDLRKENAQQTLDKERLAKEKEIERNELIASQKIQLEKDVADRTAELKQSIEELKATQSQLIQSEKMASLGELTAGIAHEIQNPLNFVNNFSEVSNELIDEMNTELNKGDIEEAKAISNDIKQNLEKISHHGKRADAIVKGMLQHSRSSSGVKEPTDINKLADEYLRLAYHGLRAKDKSFNATLKTDFDESIGKINIIPQDMGRVILNLITNAFYVVDEKKKASASSAGQPYEPTVSVSTKKINDNVEIIVADNGNGIPQKVLDKIFQPFFTTKPTGQGTGLGLSLSYDIVKAHGGELKVETREGEGSTFIIQLPNQHT